MNAGHSTVLDRVERLLERNRERGGLPDRQEVDDLYTDACATVLALEGELREIERRLAEALVDTSDDTLVVKRSRGLVERRSVITRELCELQSLVRGLATVADWMRDPTSADVHQLYSD